MTQVAAERSLFVFFVETVFQLFQEQYVDGSGRFGGGGFSVGVMKILLSLAVSDVNNSFINA